MRYHWRFNRASGFGAEISCQQSEAGVAYQSWVDQTATQGARPRDAGQEQQGNLPRPRPCRNDGQISRHHHSQGIGCQQSNRGCTRGWKLGWNFPTTAADKGDETDIKCATPNPSKLSQLKLALPDKP